MVEQQAAIRPLATDPIGRPPGHTGPGVRVRHSASLPAGYQLHGTVDLKRDRKQLVAIQVVAVLVVGAMVGPVLLLDLLPAGGWSTGVTIAVTPAASDLRAPGRPWCGEPRP